MTMPMNSVDIAIVGAGLVGTPLAKVLAGQGWRVALLDAGSQADRASANSAQPLTERCTALSLGSRQWLETQGLWSGLADDACAIGQVHVSHKGYFGSTRLDARELDVDAVGYVLANTRMNAAFIEQLSHTPVQYICDARVEAVVTADDHVQINYGERKLQARLLIAADGVSSTVRESVGIRTEHVDYEQCAALGTVQLNRPHNNIAYERFTASGPLAFLPRPGARMSFVDCMDPDDRESVAGMNDQQYLARLQQRFGYRLGRLAAVGPRLLTPLVRIEASEQVGTRVVLLGNAMRLLHPVGGQGFNLALRDVAELCNLLGNHRSGDPGAAELLNTFSGLRKKDQHQVVSFTDLLARGFRGQASLPAHVRALGLLGLDSASPLRQRFARRTMGVS